MAEQEEPDGDEGSWEDTIQLAADAALRLDSVEVGPTREIVFYGRKKNPIHEYKAKLKPPE